MPTPGAAGANGSNRDARSRPTRRRTTRRSSRTDGEALRASAAVGSVPGGAASRLASRRAHRCRPPRAMSRRGTVCSCRATAQFVAHASASTSSRRPWTVSSMSSKQGPGLPPTRIPQIKSRALAAASDVGGLRRRPAEAAAEGPAVELIRSVVALADGAEHRDELVSCRGIGGPRRRRHDRGAWRAGSPSGVPGISLQGLAGRRRCWRVALSAMGSHLVGGAGGRR